MNDNKLNIKIFTFYHKSIPPVINNETYRPVMVGNTLHDQKGTFQPDDEGQNISDRNLYYCELTGIYWIWKNVCDTDVIGTSHYRRYFTAKPEPFLFRIKRFFYFFIGQHRKRSGLIYTHSLSRFVSRIITKEEVKTLLSEYEVILPQARKLRKSIRTHYISHHQGYGLDILADIIEEKYPDFKDSFIAVMNSNQLYANNMFILRREYFEEFMSWWFPILFEFEERVKKNKKDYPQRIIGFVAERLLNVWFYKKQLKQKELPLIYFKRIKTPLNI